MPILKDPAASRIIPFAVYILFLMLERPLAQVTVGMGGDARWLYALKVGIVALLLRWLWRKYTELAWPVSMSSDAWLAALLAGTAVFALWVLPYPDWALMRGSEGDFNPIRTDGAGVDYLLAATRISGAALVVPLMEELFWRSYIMRWIDRADFLAADPARVSLPAFVLTATMFAVEHNLWLAGLLAGIVYNWLYIRYRNLWAPVLAHTITNGMLGAWVLHTAKWYYW